MKVQTIIIDDFYKNPDEVRAFALAQEFSQHGNYPGQRTRPFLAENVKNSISDIIRPYAGEVTSWGDDSTGSFQYTTARDRSWIHSDDTTDWAAVLYLTPNAPISAGTGIFKHKETGVNRWRSSEHTDSENSQAPGVLHSQDFTKWEMVDRWSFIKGIFSTFRLIILGTLKKTVDFFKFSFSTQKSNACRKETYCSSFWVG
jgi:hypothetical protein